MLRPSRDPWVPWTTFSPFRATDSPRVATYGTTARPQPHSAGPAFRVLVWVRAADGSVQRVPLPLRR
jgi:hypothetical protein